VKILQLIHFPQPFEVRREEKRRDEERREEKII
jgi:hypothetical protein